MRRLALLLALVAPRLAAQSITDPVPAEPPRFLIDAHVHADGAEDRLDELRGGQVVADRSLVGMVIHLPQGVSEPGRVLDNARWCAGVGAEPDTVAIARALEANRVSCLKIYLGYVPRWASDPVYEPLYRLAARHGAPVVFHTGDTSDPDALIKYADPLTIDEVAVAHRDVTFVIAHCGNPWLQSAAEVAYKNPNVMLECSALMTGNVDEIEPEIRERYVVDAIRWVFGYVEDPAKLMFGTDWPLVEQAPYVRAYMEAIPEAHWDAVFFGNAVRVFGF
jgi:predicted TIM-barrel fold metal-dependent hydrolase